MTQTKVVPIEPTEDCLDDICDKYLLNKGKFKNTGELIKFLYTNMLEAAPTVDSEPVAEIMNRDDRYNYIHWYTLLQELKVGTKLYTHPDPRIAELEAKLKVAREAMLELKMLIKFVYTGSKEIMSALQHADNTNEEALNKIKER